MLAPTTNILFIYTDDQSTRAAPNSSKLGDAAFDAYVTIDATARGALASQSWVARRGRSRRDPCARWQSSAPASQE